MGLFDDLMQRATPPEGFPPHLYDALTKAGFTVDSIAETKLEGTPWVPLMPSDELFKAEQHAAAVKAMQAQRKKQKTARTRVLNKALRAHGIDPADWKRMVRHNYHLTAAEFEVLIDEYRSLPDDHKKALSQRQDWRPA
jgi:hypothetical protein